MTQTPRKPRRLVAARRALTVGTLAAGLATAAHAAVLTPAEADLPDSYWLAAGDGEEEGEGEATEARLDDDAFLVALGRLEGQLRAATALAGEGDAKGAAALLDRSEDATLAALDARGTDVTEALDALGTALREGHAQAQYDTARDLFETARRETTARAQFRSLITLTREAGKTYGNAVDGTKITDLAAYRAAWGMIQLAKTEAGELAKAGNDRIARAGQGLLDALAFAAPAFTDLQGDGLQPDASLLHGAAGRMELALSKVY
ncbi:MAG: hypothetical protein RIC49_12175 [Phycisphaerales bacterium]